MAEKPATLEDNIQLAIDAATAANDATADLVRLKDKTELAAESLEQSIKMARPLALGAVLGIGLAAVLAGAVVVIAVSHLRVAREANEETLARVEEAVAMLEGDRALSAAALEQLSAANTSSEERVLATIETGFAALSVSPEGGALALDSREMSQMLAALADLNQTLHDETRETVSLALSELQLALTEVLASEPFMASNREDEAALVPARPRLRPQARAAETVRVAPSAPPPPVARTRRAARPSELNPFQYP
ncbi:MAG: hypothetical protein MK180_06885 [Rhodobacteraceae bacterium]|nr:hypothetical protein [Paracoccaceae bacterium]